MECLVGPSLPLIYLVSNYSINSQDARVDALLATVLKSVFAKSKLFSPLRKFSRRKKEKSNFILSKLDTLLISPKF